MRERTATIYTLTEYEFSILGSKHPTVLFTDHKPIIWTGGKNLALPDTLSRNTPPELLAQKKMKYHKI